MRKLLHALVNNAILAMSLFALSLLILYSLALSAQVQKKQQLPCKSGAKVFVLEPEQIEPKVRELNAEGYCIHKNNFLVVGNRVVLTVGEGDLYEEEEEEEPVK